MPAIAEQRKAPPRSSAAELDAPRVTIVGPWWRPLPPVRDGAPEWVIEHTVRRLRRLQPALVSPWHPALSEAGFDLSRYRHVRPGLKERVAVRLPFRLQRAWFGTSDPGGVAYVSGLARTLRQLQPQIIVAHVLPGLSRVARGAIPTARIVHYSHTNDLKEMPETEWTEFSRCIDGLITVSQAGLDGVLSRWGPLPFPTAVIPNGVDLEGLRPADSRTRGKVRQRLGLGEGPVIVYCGRLHPRKGADMLLHAFAAVRRSVPRAQLLIVGASTHMKTGTDGFTRDLMALAERCGSDAVRFTGYVPSPKLGAVLAAADVGVLPSVEDEGMPLSILEFAACGMPVIATQVGGVPEVIRDGLEGLLIERNRVGVDLQIALERLCLDSELRETLGRAARKRAEDRFSWDRVAADFERVLDEFGEHWRGED